MSAEQHASADQLRPLWRQAIRPRNWVPGLGCGLAWLAVRILPQRGLLGLGAALGMFYSLVARQRREVVSTNLAACFPDLSDDQREALSRDCFRSTGKGLVESCLAFWGRDDQLRDLAAIHGGELLDQALSSGRGVLIVMAHYPTVELACRLANLGRRPPTRMLARRNNNPFLESVLERGRCRHSGPTLEKKDLRGLLRTLRSGQAVFYAPDQNFTYQSVFAPFFGIPAATVTATAEIVSRSGAVMLRLWCQRLEGGRYSLRYEPPWPDFPSGDAEADAARINGWIEQRIREAPAQYLWMHRRFRTRPDGEPPFYPARARRAKHRTDQ